MHKSTRPKMLNGTATAHITQAEEERIQRRAAEAGLSKSEWCRQAILNALETPPDTRLLLAEFLALRALVLALHTDILQGNKLTEQRVAAAIQQVEAKKFIMAENRLRAFQLNGKLGAQEPTTS